MINRKQAMRLAKNILFEDKEMGGEMTNAFGIGQVNSTLLAETIVYESDLPEDVLGDECHWVWDIAIDAGRWFERLTGAPE